MIRDTVWDGLGDVGTFVNYGYVETTEDLAQEPGWRLPKEEDLAEARRLIVEAGYPDGFKGTMNSGSSPTGVGQASIVTEQLRAVGLDFTIDSADTATYHVRTRDGTHNLTSVVSAVIIPDPSDLLAQVFSLDIEKNPDNWSTPRFAELIVAQERELDADKRKAIFKEIVDILRTGGKSLGAVSLYDQRRGLQLPHAERGCAAHNSDCPQVGARLVGRGRLLTPSSCLSTKTLIE